jgi:hypothetical protein
MSEKIDFLTVVMAVLVLLGISLFGSLTYYTLRRSIYVSRVYPKFRERLDQQMRQEFFLKPWNIFLPWKINRFTSQQYYEKLLQLQDETLQGILAKEKKCWSFWIIFLKVFGLVFSITIIAYVILARN